MFLFDADYLVVVMKLFSAVTRAGISFQKWEKRKCSPQIYDNFLKISIGVKKKNNLLRSQVFS